MFNWFKQHTKIYELESFLQVERHHSRVLEGEVERLTTERNHLMDVILRSSGAAPLYSPEPGVAGVGAEREVTRDHPAPRNMRDWQSQLQDLERQALSNLS